GQFSLHEGQARVVLAGITLNQIEASVRMLGDTVVIDSVAANNNGHILLTGGIGLKSLTAPSFDLRLVTNNAEVLHNEHGRLTVSARLAMNDPYEEAHEAGDVHIGAGGLDVHASDN